MAGGRRLGYARVMVDKIAPKIATAVDCRLEPVDGEPLGSPDAAAAASVLEEARPAAGSPDNPTLRLERPSARPYSLAHATARAEKLIAQATVTFTGHEPELRPARLAELLAAEDPRSGVVNTTYRRLAAEPLGHFTVAELTRAWYGLAKERLAELPVSTQRLMLEGALKIGSELDREIYDLLDPGLRRRAYDHGVATFADTDGAQLARACLGSMLHVDGSGEVATYDGVKIPMARPSAAQAVLSRTYRAIEGDLFNDPASVASAMKPEALVPGALGKLHTVVYRPGLGNVPPSASALFLLARHADKVVLAYSNDAGADKALRPLTHHLGVPVPEELRGKLFAVGSEERIVQRHEAGAGVLIRQLEELRARGPALGIDTDQVTMFGHSAGNLDTVQARLTLAAHGFPEVIKRHVAIGAPFRGSIVADNGATRGLVWFLGGAFFGGRPAYDAIAALSPEHLERRLPEVARRTVDLALYGDPSAKDGRYPHVGMRLGAGLASTGLGGRQGSDGLVDYRGQDFVAAAGAVVYAPTDHMGINTDPKAMRALLERLSDYSDEGLELLRKIAGKRPEAPAATPEAVPPPADVPMP